MILYCMSNKTDEIIEDIEILSIDDFRRELLANLDTFVVNMKSLNFKETTFPEWFETFMSWTEVGTDMEYEYYGPRIKNEKLST